MAVLILVALYIITISALIFVGKTLRKKYAILTYNKVMRCIIVPITLPCNVTVSVMICRFFILQRISYWNWSIPDLFRRVGYLGVAFYVALFLFLMMYLFIIDRALVTCIIEYLWKKSYMDNIIENIKFLEKKKEEYPSDSEWYAETICKLRNLYTTFIVKAKKSGKNEIALEYENQRKLLPTKLVVK